MGMETAVSSGAFTDEILSKNFLEIAKGFSSVDNRLDMFDSWIKHIEGHVTELYQMASETAKVATKGRGMKTKHKVIIAVGVGLYLGRKSMTNEFNRRMEQVKREAKEQYDNFVASQQNVVPDAAAKKKPEHA